MTYAPSRPSPRLLRATVVSAALSALIAVSACTGGDGDQAEQGGQGQGGGQGTQQDASASGEQQPARELGDLGSREGIVDRVPATVVLSSVSAQGQTLTVTFTVTNDSESDRMSIGSAFSNDLDDTSGDAGQSSAERNSVDGVYLTTEEGKRYLVGRGENGICACSSGLSSVSVDPGQSYTLSATFAAPPEEVETVTVHIPGYGAFEGVGIAR